MSLWNKKQLSTRLQWNHMFSIEIASIDSSRNSNCTVNTIKLISANLTNLMSTFIFVQTAPPNNMGENTHPGHKNQSWNSPFLLARRSKCMHQVICTVHSSIKSLRTPHKGSPERVTLHQKRQQKQPRDISKMNANPQVWRWISSKCRWEIPFWWI